MSISDDEVKSVIQRVTGLKDLELEAELSQYDEFDSLALEEILTVIADEYGVEVPEHLITEEALGTPARLGATLRAIQDAGARQ